MATKKAQIPADEKIEKQDIDLFDVLAALDKKDYLNRRLQTILVQKRLATTAKSARQLITLKKLFHTFSAKTFSRFSGQ